MTMDLYLQWLCLSCPGQLNEHIFQHSTHSHFTASALSAFKNYTNVVSRNHGSLFPSHFQSTWVEKRLEQKVSIADLLSEERGDSPGTSVEHIQKDVPGFCSLHLFPQMLHEKCLDIHPSSPITSIKTKKSWLKGNSRNGRDEDKAKKKILKGSYDM